LSKLLRYKSLNHMDKDISLDDYVKDMKKDQKDIYFISGESVRAVINSPFLERLKSNGYDVLLHIDPLDEYVSQQLKEYDASELETSVRALSHHSLRGIKFIGALSGLVVGLIALLGGNI